MKNMVEGNNQATMAAGLTHIIGGALAINIFPTLRLFNNTFGVNFIT
jgi:hypothetical protein